jgi:hypothetical protein
LRERLEQPDVLPYAPDSTGRPRRIAWVEGPAFEDKTRNRCVAEQGDARDAKPAKLLEHARLEPWLFV